MALNKKESTLRRFLILPIVISFGFLFLGNRAFSQTPQPPPPPPSPKEVFNKINPFKKKSKDTSAKKAAPKQATTAPVVAPAGPPPPPPPPSKVFNKINPFKKKKKDTVSTAKPSGTK
jgi:hypothetical protein